MIFTSLLLSFLVGGHDVQASPELASRNFRFVYKAAVPEVPEGSKQVRLWIPVPVDTPDQEISKLMLGVKPLGDSGTQSTAASMARTPDQLKDGGAGDITWVIRDIQGGSGRSACIQSSGTPFEVELSFDVLRHETHGGGQATPDELAMLKQPNAMIPLTGKVSAVAASLKLPGDPLAAARLLYDHTLERMKYDKPESGGWGRGDAEWACDAKFGNCTDFHSYFMGLARSKGMSARFEMGFPIVGGDEKEAKVGGYHCWAYVWIDGHGWFPVDISEADKHPEKADYFFGTLDCDRVTMTGGRDLTLDPSPAQGNVNFFVYPIAEADGKPLEGVTKAFSRINL